MLFERSPERYRRARPPYPDELWDVLADLGVARPGARALDLAAGAGAATGPLLERGAAVDAIEPGRRLADLLHADFPDVDVQVTTAEQASYPASAYDGVVCATALHWLDLPTVLPLVRSSLRDGGWFVPFWHVFQDPEAEPTPFRLAVNEMFGGPPKVEGSALDQEHWGERLTQDGHFDIADIRVWRWCHRLDTDQLRDLLLTFNGWTDGHIATAVAAAERLGGVVSEHGTTVAYLCRPR